MLFWRKSLLNPLTDPLVNVSTVSFHIYQAATCKNYVEVLETHDLSRARDVKWCACSNNMMCKQTFISFHSGAVVFLFVFVFWGFFWGSWLWNVFDSLLFCSVRMSFVCEGDNPEPRIELTQLCEANTDTGEHTPIRRQRAWLDNTAGKRPFD